MEEIPRSPARGWFRGSGVTLTHQVISVVGFSRSSKPERFHGHTWAPCYAVGYCSVRRRIGHLLSDLFGGEEGWSTEYRSPWANFPDVAIQTTVNKLRSRPAYDAAKRGGGEA